MNDEGFVFVFLESVVKLAGGVFEQERLEIGEGGFHGDYLRRLTLLAERGERIWVMAISLSFRRRSGAVKLWGMKTELRRSRLARTTSCSSGA